jgi:hypothetical protein
MTGKIDDKYKEAILASIPLGEMKPPRYDRFPLEGGIVRACLLSWEGCSTVTGSA